MEIVIKTEPEWIPECIIKEEEEEEEEKEKSPGPRSPSLSCKLCHKVFARRKMLESHEKLAKCQQPQAKRLNQKKFPFVIRCAWCWTAFPNKVDLKAHIVSDHDGVFPFSCDQCDKGYISKCFLVYHVDKVHKGIVKDKEKLTFSCKQCDKVYTAKQNLVLHVDKVHKGLVIPAPKRVKRKLPSHPCKQCDKSLSSKLNLANHIKKIHNSNVIQKPKSTQNRATSYPCKHCDGVFTSRWFLVNHIDKDHLGGTGIVRKKLIKSEDKSTHPCSQCDKVYETNRSLQRHVKVDHLRTRKRFCEICGDSFYTNTQFIYHSNKVHHTEDIECEFCHRKFYLRSNLTKHIDAMHLKTTTFICNQCGKSFPRNCQLKIHVAKIHDQKKVFCEHCGKSFFLASRLKKHMANNCTRVKGDSNTDLMCTENCTKTKDSSPHVHCSKCDRTFAREVSMLVHFKVVHESAMLISCHKCEDTTFDNNAQYLIHCNEVHNDEEHKCKMCPLKFTDLLSLKNHKLSEHRAEMKCTICEEKFYTSLQLEYHTNKVHGLNVYECENCPRKFYLQALCKRHNETVHLKIKPFQCEECSETFASKIQRLTHAVKVHNFSKFQCKICDRKFPGVNILNKHMAKKHSDVEPS